MCTYIHIYKCVCVHDDIMTLSKFFSCLLLYSTRFSLTFLSCSILSCIAFLFPCTYYFLLFVRTLLKVDLYLTLKATVNAQALYIHQNVKTMKEVRKLFICERELSKDNKVKNDFYNIISRSDKNLGQEINDLNLQITLLQR